MQIQLNTKSVTSQFSMTQRQVENFIDYVVKDIAASYVRKWEGAAKRRLHSTRKIYIQNLRVIDEGRMKGAVLLDYTQAPIVRFVEEGVNAFDIKDGFAKSKKRHITSSGWYLNIPFRIGVPGTIGEANAFPVKSMPAPIHKALQTADISHGLQTKDIPKPFNKSQIRGGLSVLETHTTYQEYQHKSSIYAGIVKKKDSITGQNSYMSFRRVSNMSDPMSFIHTGIIAYNLSDDAMKELNANMSNELQVATDAALDKLGF